MYVKNKFRSVIMTGQKMVLRKYNIYFEITIKNPLKNR